MTGLGKQAKTLSDTQLKRLLFFVGSETRFPERNVVIVNLSFRAGLRSKEIACLTWDMCVTDGIVGGEDQELEIRDIASKGKHGGRRIPMNDELKVALTELYALEQRKGMDFVPIETDAVEQSTSFQLIDQRLLSKNADTGTPARGTAKAFVIALAKGNTDMKSRAASVAFLMNGSNVQQGWYKKLGFAGVTSHSGRRTFLTKAARMVSSVGGSLADVMELSGHKQLQNLVRYIDENKDAKRKLVGKM